MALLCWKLIKPSTAIAVANQSDVSLSLRELWQYRNIRIGLVLACLLLTWLNACMTFMPRYFTEMQNFTEAEMGKTMGLMGVSSLLSGLIVTGLSDRFGRKPVINLFLLGIDDELLFLHCFYEWYYKLRIGKTVIILGVRWFFQSAERITH